MQGAAAEADVKYSLRYRERAAQIFGKKMNRNGARSSEFNMRLSISSVGKVNIVH